MKLWIQVVFACVVMFACSTKTLAQENEKGFKKSNFYTAMSGDKEEPVNQQLDLLKNAVIPEKDAYEGALLMKKAGIVGGAKKKLDLFKAGHKKLEAVISKDSTNVEYRFLRLMIQEHAPGILGYKGELEKDRLFIKNNFKKMPAIAKEAAENYSKESKILKPADL
ncbi:MAG: hypothetical protein QM726_25740 [Chitinophagaceae bacterium]